MLEAFKHLCASPQVKLLCLHSGVVDPRDILTETEQKFARENPRGFGYWFWKPRLIQQTMSRVADGELILYVDGGCRLGLVGNSITHLADRLQTSQNKYFMAVPFPNHEYVFSKADLIDAIQLPSHKKESILESHQLQAGIMLIHVSPESRKIVSQWVDIMHPDRFHLFDDTPSVIPNHPDFVENRHDQSVFSLLMKKHEVCIPLFWFPGIYAVRNFRDLPGFLSSLVDSIVWTIL